MTATADAAVERLDPELLADIRAHASALDRGEETSRRSFTRLGAAGLLGLGAPGNTDGRLPRMADVIGLISGECMSTGFSVWANRMALGIYSRPQRHSASRRPSPCLPEPRWE